jgi:hypothetical protein
MWIVMVLIVAVVLIACLIYFRVPLAKKDELAKTVSIIGTITAAISLGWAAYTYTDSKERQNRALATSIYQEHMKTSMEAQNKDYLGIARFAQMDPQNIPDSDKNEYEKYQWYVGNSLFNFESISELDNDRCGRKLLTALLKPIGTTSVVINFLAIVTLPI